MSTHVAHQFDDAHQQFAAARLGMWIFLATEVLFFGGLFAGYAYYRTMYPAAFVEGSRHLDVVLGTINTGVLLLSSLTMVLAVRGTQVGDRRATVALLLMTMMLGVVFLGIKGHEYRLKFAEHHVPGRSFTLGEIHDPTVDPAHVELFFSFYFGMTGLHALHMMVGIGVVAVVCYVTWKGVFSEHYYTPLEVSGLYWHFVDIVWVFLFPLLYLIR